MVPATPFSWTSPPVQTGLRSNPIVAMPGPALPNSFQLSVAFLSFLLYSYAICRKRQELLLTRGDGVVPSQVAVFCDAESQ